MFHLTDRAVRLLFLIALLAASVACASVKRPVASNPDGDKPKAGVGTLAGSGPAPTTGEAAATATPLPAPQPAPTPESGDSQVADASERGSDSTSAPEAARADSGSTAGGASPSLLGIPSAAGSEPSGSGESAKSPAGAESRSGGGGGAGGGTGGAPATPTTPHVRMVPSASQVSVGTRLSIRVRIEGSSDMGSVPFHVVYNPAVLKFEGGREGPFLGGGGRQTAFFAAPMSGGDEMVVGLSRLGAGHGIAGSGDLCTLEFTVVGPGDAGLAFARAHVRDSANRIQPAVFEPASVTAH